MSYLEIVIVTVVTVFIINGYFVLAKKFSIVDIPNNRSSHRGIIIRGAGIVFPIAVLLWSVWYHNNEYYFLIGLIGISIVSFIDDIKPLTSRLRSSIQILSVTLLLYQLALLNSPIWLILILIILSVGTINAFNFMDGINGMTGIYALVFMISAIMINLNIDVLNDGFLLSLIVAVVVFLFYNFRVKAKCFAGDVGSVSIAFISIFLLLKIMIATNNFWWILLFLVYGIETVFTILIRLKDKENIFQPHRRHLYQYLSNELKFQHRWVALGYGVVQLLVNFILMSAIIAQDVLVIIITVVGVALIYSAIRLMVYKNITRSKTL